MRRAGTRPRLDPWPALHTALLMAVGMGVGRFSFTALYPHMVDDGVIDVATGSLAASANYAGYLLGAVLALRVRAHNARACSALALAGTVGCLAILGITGSAAAIVAVRALAGVLSALTMVAASVWLLENRRHLHGVPVLFAGVGAGIAVSAELLVGGVAAGLDSHGLWWLMAGTATLLGLLGLRGLGGHGPADAVAPTGGPAPETPDTSAVDNPPVAAGLPTPPTVDRGPLTLVYGLAGFGYIVTATYLPLLMAKALPGTDPAHAWALFGLSAAPSCFLWYRLRRRLGTARSLTANLLVQAFGVALPLFSGAAAAHMASAALVGGTFLGVMIIVMPEAQRIARATGANVVARLTIAYSTGQIAGPMLAGALFERTHGFGAALACAAAALCLGAAVSAWRFPPAR